MNRRRQRRSWRRLGGGSGHLRNLENVKRNEK
ncbi:hypothetical protein TIFTF001_052361, partial [Ficus carica]